MSTDDEQDAMNASALKAFVMDTRRLLIDKHRSDYRLGEKLHAIRTQELWSRWPREDRKKPGYESFAEFCDREMGYSASQAGMKASNYVKLSAMRLDENGETFARCMRLGWSKLNVLLRVAGDEDNLIAWLNDIEGKNLSEMQLRERIATARQAHTGTTGEGDGAGDADGDAPGDAPPPRDYIPYELRFTSQSDLEAFTKAVDAVRARFDSSMGMGSAVGMMAVQYLATTPRRVEGGVAAEVENMLRLIEGTYGLKLSVITPGEEAGGRRKPRSKTLAKMLDGSR